VDLPLVLAGPILRRCAARSVFVWVAFSEDVTSPDPITKASRSLELEIYSAKTMKAFMSLNDTERCTAAVAGNYKRKRDKAGQVEKTPSGHRGTVRAYFHALDHLHVYLVEAIPFDDDLPGGEILGYEIYLVEEAAQADAAGVTSRCRYGLCDHLHSDSVANADLFKKGTPLYQRGYSDDPEMQAGGTLSLAGVKMNSPVYPAEWRPVHLIRDWSAETGKWCFPLPTFVLQKHSEAVRAWAASCFKLHGQPLSASLLMYDASAKSAECAGLLYSVARSTALRPHMLVLMGDQIYADDVAFVVAEGVAGLRGRLTGDVDEMMPLPIGVGCKDFDWRQRRKFVGATPQSKKGKDEYSPFRLEEGVENQMFTFSEYAALYLYHLNPALWQAPHDQLALPPKDRMHWKKRLEIELKRLSKNRVAVLQYATVKANIPTYMLCDDHEVTDDWFFDKEWIDAVRPALGKPSGTQREPSVVGQYIVANAMHAYYVFQGVGNSSEIQIAPDRLGRPDKDSYQNNLKILLGGSWSFIIPSSPPVLCLDTRTQRSGSGDPTTRPSSGFDRIQLDRRWEGGPHERVMEKVDTHHESGARLLVESSTLGKLVAAVTHEGRVIMVTPSPVLSSDNIALRKEVVGSARENDAEGWRDNYSNYFQLVDTLLAALAKTCLVISGDFHYGYRRSTVVTKKSLTATMGETTIEQIVSSSVLNPYEREFGGGRSWIVEKLGESNFVGDYGPTLRYTPGTSGTGSALNRWRIALDDYKFTVGVPPPSYSERVTGVLPDIRTGKAQRGHIVWSAHFVEVVVGETVEAHFYVQERQEDV
jgi:hypothetical protein